MTTEIFRTTPGQSVRFSVPLSVLGVAPTLLPTGITLTVECLEQGAPDPPIVDHAPVYDGSTATAANYHSDQVFPLNSTPGRWAGYWVATGPTPAQCGVGGPFKFYVDPLPF